MWPKEDLLYINPMTSLSIFVFIYTTLLPPLWYVRSSAKITLKGSHKVFSCTFFLVRDTSVAWHSCRWICTYKGPGTTEAILIKATQLCPPCLHIAQENHLYRVKETKVFRLYSEIYFYLFSDLQNEGTNYCWL